MIIDASPRARHRARDRRLATLDMTINYTVTLPTTAKAATMTALTTNKSTFEAAVKTQSVAKLASGKCILYHSVRDYLFDYDSYKFISFVILTILFIPF